MDIKPLCYKVMLYHFTELVGTDLLNSCECIHLHELLEHRELRVSSEETKWESISHWIRSASETLVGNPRLDDLHELLLLIDWTLITISLENLPDFWELALAANSSILKPLCLMAMVYYFNELVTSEMLRSLDFVYFIEILQSSDLHVTREELKWKAVVGWIKETEVPGGENPRMIHLSALMFEIKWIKIPRNSVVNMMVINAMLRDVKYR